MLQGAYSRGGVRDDVVPLVALSPLSVNLWAGLLKGFFLCRDFLVSKVSSGYSSFLQQSKGVRIRSTGYFKFAPVVNGSVNGWSVMIWCLIQGKAIKQTYIEVYLDRVSFFFL